MTESVSVNRPDNGVEMAAPGAFAPGMIEIREWMREALYAAGAIYGGGSGFGCGGADIDIEKDGKRYNVFIRPLPDR